MNRKETMARINEMTKQLVAQEDECKRERAHMHMIQLKINRMEGHIAGARTILSKLHQHLGTLE